MPSRDVNLVQLGFGWLRLRSSLRSPLQVHETQLYSLGEGRYSVKTEGGVAPEHSCIL